MSTVPSAVPLPAALSIHLLGAPRVLADGVDATQAIRYRKGLALLGYLAAEHSRQHSREFLADLLWPGHDMVAARTNLRQVLTPLARVLNRDGNTPELVTSKDAIGWFPGADTALDLDAIALRSDFTTIPAEAEREIALVRGEFLAGLALPDCAEFEAWLEQTRHAIHLRASAYLERLCFEHERAAQWPLAILSAERLIALDAWYEPHHRLLMRLLARSGQPRAALAVYDGLERSLREHLEVEPEAQTRGLHAEIQAASLGDSGPAPATPSSERRWLALVCCQVHSPLEEAAHAAERCGELLARAAEHLRAAGGSPLPPLGHRLLACFGAHERDEALRRAALAALEIQRGAPAQASARIAIHAGTSLVHTVAGVAQPIGALADTAWRLTAFVGEGEIAISEPALAELRVQHLTDPLGTRLLPDVAAPLAIHRLIDVGDAPRPASSAPPLAGRAAELATLAALWQDARAGRRRIGLVIGEPGIGKTRLLDEVVTRATADGARALCLGARAESGGRPLAPFAHWLAGLAGVDGDDTPAQRRHRLAAHLEHAIGGARAAALGAALAGLVGGDHGEGAAQRESCSAALIELFHHLAGAHAPLIRLEDAHWADSSTLELLPRLCAGGGLVLVSVRPEGIPPGLPAGAVTPLMLRALDAQASRALARARLGDREMTEARMRELLHLAGGNPLALEGYVRFAQRLPAAALPLTWPELLQARLDRLGNLKPLLQAAAVIGQRFPARLLARLLEAPAVGADLEQACRSGVIEACGGGEYRFRHALLREAAARSLPHARRRALHAGVHRLLALDATQPPEERARHLEGAGEYAAAAEHWQRAGQLALERGFTPEGIAHLERALKLHSLGNASSDAPPSLHRQLDAAYRHAATRPAPATNDAA